MPGFFTFLPNFKFPTLNSEHRNVPKFSEEVNILKERRIFIARLATENYSVLEDMDMGGH